MNLKTAFAVVLLSACVAGCSTTDRPDSTGPSDSIAPAASEEETIAPEEGASLMARLGERVQTACGADTSCLAIAGRVAGYVWQYRESVTIQARVFRCVGQYGVTRGYRWGVRRFIGDGGKPADGPGMVTYLYECAVPDWARKAFETDPAANPPVPRAGVAAGQTRTEPLPDIPAPESTRRQPLPAIGEAALQ